MLQHRLANKMIRCVGLTSYRIPQLIQQKSKQGSCVALLWIWQEFIELDLSQSLLDSNDFLLNLILTDLLAYYSKVDLISSLFFY